MRISGRGKETYLLLNGIEVKRPIFLGKNIELQPTKCSPDPDLIIKISKNEIDLGIAAIFLRQVKNQIRVVAKTPKELAKTAWNTLWDAVLLSAFCQCDAVCNFQCDTSADKFTSESNLEVTNYHLRGLALSGIYTVTDKESNWIEQNFEKARNLLNKSEFQNAVYSLSSYRWHPNSRAQLAILWSGIEGLFRIDSEIVFRLSLYTARFLEPNDEDERIKVFSEVKRLYKQRSSAVHGSKIKGESNAGVNESADLLLKLIRQCVANDDLPVIEKLVP